jgi:hypothetical protein
LKNEITLRFSKLPQTAVKIKLVDMNGRVLLTSELNQLSQTQVTLDVSRFARGAYQLQVVTDGQKFNRQVVKQ